MLPWPITTGYFFCSHLNPYGGITDKQDASINTVVIKIKTLVNPDDSFINKKEFKNEEIQSKKEKTKDWQG